MGNAQGIERRIRDEASHYEGDLCFASFGTGGCFGRQPASGSSCADHDGHKDRGSAQWERDHGLEPIRGMHKPHDLTAQAAGMKMKRPCLVSCSLGNCLAPKRARADEDHFGDEDGDDAHHRGRDDQGQSIFSCGFARIGCLGVPTWLNPAPRPEMGDEEEVRRRVDTDIVLLKARQASKHEQQLKKLEKRKRKQKGERESGEVEISGPHLETFRRTTDHFISAHLAMCPDPRARVKLDSGEGPRVVSLEASAPPPPSTDGTAEDQHTATEDEDDDEDDDGEEEVIASRHLPPAHPLPAAPPPVPVASDSRGRPPTTTEAEKDPLPAPRHLPPPPPPPSSTP